MCIAFSFGTKNTTGESHFFSACSITFCGSRPEAITTLSLNELVATNFPLYFCPLIITLFTAISQPLSPRRTTTPYVLLLTHEPLIAIVPLLLILYDYFRTNRKVCPKKSQNYLVFPRFLAGFPPIFGLSFSK